MANTLLFSRVKWRRRRNYSSIAAGQSSQHAYEVRGDVRDLGPAEHVGPVDEVAVRGTVPVEHGQREVDLGSAADRADVVGGYQHGGHVAVRRGKTRASDDRLQVAERDRGVVQRVEEHIAQAIERGRHAVGSGRADGADADRQDGGEAAVLTQVDGGRAAVDRDADDEVVAASAVPQHLQERGDNDEEGAGAFRGGDVGYGLPMRGVQAQVDGLGLVRTGCGAVPIPQRGRLPQPPPPVHDVVTVPATEMDQLRGDGGVQDVVGDGQAGPQRPLTFGDRRGDVGDDPDVRWDRPPHGRRDVVDAAAAGDAVEEPEVALEGRRGNGGPANLRPLSHRSSPGTMSPSTAAIGASGELVSARTAVWYALAMARVAVVVSSGVQNRHRT